MGKTVSIMFGKGSLAHNNRTFSTENVDPVLTPKNVVFVQQKLKDAYQEIFGEALERYNQKQKRNDRKIPDYYEHIRKSKNGEKLYHELVVQVGNRSDTGIGSVAADKAKNILTQYYHDFQQRNPHMHVFNAVLHMDEPDGTPHLHIDFIPTGTGYKRGLDIQNSMRQALKQQGFDYEPTYVNMDSNISVSYGKNKSKIGGGRWLEAEREKLGALLGRHGIQWDKQNTHREHLNISEFKACAEIISREIEQLAPAELGLREPNAAMRIAGVKADEVIVARSSVEAVQQENVMLRAQAEIHQKTIHKMDDERITSDNSAIRAYKKAANMQKQAETVIVQAQQEIAAAKEKYDSGTAERYQELFQQYREATAIANSYAERYAVTKQQKEQLEVSIPAKIENAVAAATASLQAENTQLREEISRWKEVVTALKERVREICQTLHDVVRAVFLLKYNGKDKAPNPYKSVLTDHADHLIDALEGKTRLALLNADCPDLEKRLDSMGVTTEFEQKVQEQLPKLRPKNLEMGD